MKPAIVVYSLTGHTRRIGAEIAQRLGCPMVGISEHELGSPQHAARLDEFIAAIRTLKEGG